MLSHPLEMFLSLSDIARLAHVQRPVVSMWRRRTALSDDPFPAPVRHHGEQELFDSLQVGQWLERTGRGNNPSAEQDAPAYSQLSRATLNDLSAALTLRALVAEPISQWSVENLLNAADEHDPDDDFIFTELASSRDQLTYLALVADQMTDAAYTPEAALEQLLADRKYAALPNHQLTAVTEDLAKLCAVLARSLAENTNISTFSEATPGGAELLVTLIHLLEETHWSAVDLLQENIDSQTTQDTPHRLAHRRLQTLAASRDWISLPQLSSHPSPRVIMAQFPGPSNPYASEADTFQHIDELILSLGEHDSALVIAPASILIDDLEKELESHRSQMLRSGRVRAAIRLPQGLIPTKVRSPMALWVLGPERRDVAISTRKTMIADLTDIPLTIETRQDLVSDVTSTLGSKQEVHARAFRFGRLVPTSSLIAEADALTSRLRAHPHVHLQGNQPNPETLIGLEQSLALWERREQALPALPITVEGRLRHPASWTTLESLLKVGVLEYLPGTRIGEDELSAPHQDGLPVWDIQNFSADTNAKNVRRLPLTDFSLRHPSAQLTEPGDVVFHTGQPRIAQVDPQGATIIRYPLRSLKPKPNCGIVPQVLAEDLLSSSGGPWRQWQVRKFSPEAATELAEALEQLDRIRHALTDRIEHLDDLTSLLTAGVAAGSVRPIITRKGKP